MTTFEDWKRQAEITGLSLAMWDCVREEYRDAYLEATSEEERDRLQAEWTKIDAYYQQVLQDNLDCF